MIRVPPQPEPDHFDEQVRKLGRAWLSKPGNRNRDRPRDYWKNCRNELRQAFVGRCGYAATWIASGTTDHFVSWADCKLSGAHKLAYEWTNYRWIMPELNSKKNRHGGLLDPFEVKDGWFEVRIPSLTLHLTDKVPREKRAQAEDTIKKLALKDGELVMRLREAELALFRSGANLEHIEQRSPLLGQALRKLMTADAKSLTKPQLRFRLWVEAERCGA